MIYLYSGTPGSGKSLHVARTIYYHLAYRGPVICNFELNRENLKNPENLHYWPNDEITVNKIMEFCTEWIQSHEKSKEGDILLVIDEAQLIFNTRTWQAADRAGWNSFFTQHRKYLLDIIMVAQFDKMLDKQIRALIEYEQIHRKISNFGWKGKIFSLILGGGKPLFCAVKVWYPMKEKVDSDFYRASKKICSLYDTYKIFEQEKK